MLILSGAYHYSHWQHDLYRQQGYYSYHHQYVGPSPCFLETMLLNRAVDCPCTLTKTGWFKPTATATAQPVCPGGEDCGHGGNDGGNNGGDHECDGKDCGSNGGNPGGNGGNGGGSECNGKDCGNNGGNGGNPGGNGVNPGGNGGNNGNNGGNECNGKDCGNNGVNPGSNGGNPEATAVTREATEATTATTAALVTQRRRPRAAVTKRPALAALLSRLQPVPSPPVLLP